MDFITAFAVFQLFASSLCSSIIATNAGFVAPLIHRTSPEHPLYNPHETYKDIIARKQKISAERQIYFSNQRRSPGRTLYLPPLEGDVVMKFSIGTPPVRQIAVFDTASDVIWLQCKPCQRCYKQISPIFDPRKSSSYKQLLCRQCNGSPHFYCRSGTCHYKLEYADKSSSKGVMGTDTLRLPKYEYSPNITFRNTIFGCGFDNFDTYITGAGGMVGLQNKSISLIGQMKVDSFSYCVSPTGGYITFGSKSLLKGAQATLFTDDLNQYQVFLVGITVDNLKVNISPEAFDDVLIDSGTTYTYLNQVAFDALLEFIEDRLKAYQPSPQSSGWPLCYNGDEQRLSVALMPTVQFILDEDVVISLPNENVWTQKDDIGNICLKILQSEDRYMTIGSEQLNNFNVGYDLKKELLWLDYQAGCPL